MNGYGVEQDVGAAKQMFMSAMKANIITAMLKLAEILEKGLDGSAAAPEEAVRILEIARDAGSEEAMAKLAAMGK
jgi:TPR repeat protein